MMKLAAALICLAGAPLTTAAAQQLAPAATMAASQPLGPRLTPRFRSYEPQLARQTTVTRAAVAKTQLVTTLSTLGLIALGLVLILLLS